MSSLPGASEQQRVLRSPFDIETHKATFVNYLRCASTREERRTTPSRRIRNGSSAS